MSRRQMGHTAELSCGALDFHGGVHSHLHAGVVAHQRWHELVGGDSHHFSGQPHRADSDDSQRPRGNALPGDSPSRVYCRASFGTRGANVPAILRALVACGWFGIQTWIGGEAIYKICVVIFGLHPAPVANWLGITGGQFLCFLFFWGINMWVIYRGIDTIRWLLNIKAPLLLALGLLLLWWAYRTAGGFGPILSQPVAVRRRPAAGRLKILELTFFPALTGMIGFWATLSLNIPDFSRYAKIAARPGHRPGARPAALRQWRFSLLRSSRRGGDLGYHHHLRADHLGPGGSAHAVQKPCGAGSGHARAIVRRHARREHRRQCRFAGSE